MHAAKFRGVIVGVNCLPLQFLLDVPYGNVVNNGEMLDFAIQIAKGMVGTWIHPLKIHCFVHNYIAPKLYNYMLVHMERR